MKYTTVDLDGRAHVAAVTEDGLAAVRGGEGRTLSDLLPLADAERAEALEPTGPLPSDARISAPLRPSSVICIGLNYRDHVVESGMDAPERPLIFSKLRSSVIGPEDAIRIDPAVTREVDWEVELAVVIGKETKDVTADIALDHVFGYTAANDVSARDLQFSDGQWIRGKSLDTFCPLGPVVVTADEIGDPQALALSTRINGDVVQDSSTSEMVFGVAEILSYCSRSFTLLPGDVVLTGTPWGCGAFATPPRYLADGDVVEVEVQSIGLLRNPVVVL